jgi:hypothetical protein
MASLDDNLVLEKGTSLRIGSWIIRADGSGGFESYPTNQDPPEVSEATKHCEFDEFIDQLEEIGFPNLQRSPDSTQIRRNQSQNTLRIGRGLGKTAGRFQARNFDERKNHTSQSRLRR